MLYKIYEVKTSKIKRVESIYSLWNKNTNRPRYIKIKNDIKKSAVLVEHAKDSGKGTNIDIYA
ncbi:hypothetical protein COT95_00455 [Candidatus Falkowbacteria bacterium CG10_big_fil_rev_8_21_14_0_10_37_6]|uniref:Uncharacterized protein n=1 Tax=Candidatus Falkowbacteria bacterium CG10_big_fil_rev_8_21_14_0_10_37_6 TaxID=1974563 RepID=A0A2H0V7N1_9BACT|nr:MAG: hypothetical protein COT95_00455 [Candidatus Falkowbacteria bacterium CG10_big_fil_rev_8_21_14_0_10_37_6]